MYISEITENGKITATKDNGYTVSYSLEKELFESIKNSINQIKSKEELKQEFIDEKLSEMIDEEILEKIALVKEWKPRVDYAQGELVKYEGVIYRTIKGISGDMNVLPPNQMPSEFEDLTHKLPQEDGSYPIWDEGTAVTYGYELGSIVQHNDKVWIATEGNADGKNTWEPGVYGWKEID